MEPSSVVEQLICCLVGGTVFACDVMPLLWVAAVTGVLDPVADVDVKAACIFVYVTDHYLRV